MIPTQSEKRAKEEEKTRQVRKPLPQEGVRCVAYDTAKNSTGFPGGSLTFFKTKQNCERMIE